MSALITIRPPATMSASQGRAVLARHGRSFWLASLFLASDQRDDAALLYAFCREVDDLADETPDPDEARAGLRDVRAELAGVRPARSWVAALLDVANRRQLSMQAVLAVVDGVEGDLDLVRVADDRALMRYCYRVAGAVGLLMSDVIGVQDTAAQPHAVDLGLGMQLTNICRDVLEDAGRGRSYLPATRLKATGTTAAALVAGTSDPRAVTAVVRDLLALAERYYTSAERGMSHIPWRARLAIRVAARVYRRIGRRLLAVHGGNPLHGRVVVPAWEKALVVTGAVAAHIVDAFLGSSGFRASAARGHSPRDPTLHRHLDQLPGADVRLI